MAKKVKTATPPAQKVIPPMSLAKLLRFQAEVESCQAKIMALLVQRDAFVRELDKEGKLAAFTQELAKLKELSERSTLALKEVYDNIEKDLGVKLSEHTFDDRTGELVEKPKPN